jgi:hypothetical protein
MSITSLFLIFVLVCMGVAVGAIIQRAQNRRAAPPPSQAPSSETPAGNALASEGDLEIFRAWRTLSGKIWLEMDGVRLNGKESLQADQRRRLVSMLLDLRPWLENAPAAPPAAGLPAQEQGTARPLAGSVPMVRKEKPGGKEDHPEVVLKSMVDQINDVLQTKLETGPYKNRDICLTEGPGGIVLVRDGLNKYEGIEAVPDVEIQVLIRQAVTDWEKGTR